MHYPSNHIRLATQQLWGISQEQRQHSLSDVALFCFSSDTSSLFWKKEERFGNTKFSSKSIHNRSPRLYKRLWNILHQHCFSKLRPYHKLSPTYFSLFSPGIRTFPVKDSKWCTSDFSARDAFYTTHQARHSRSFQSVPRTMATFPKINKWNQQFRMI